MAEWVISSDKAAVSSSVAQRIAALSAEAIAARGRFVVALSGGSLPKIVAAGLAGLEGDVDYSKWTVLFADERCVPLDDADSNFKACWEGWLAAAGVPRDQVLSIDPDAAATSAEAAAAAYEAALETALGGDEGGLFDVALLGMGPDGHTCSLFPGHALLEESSRLVAFIENSPKLPPRRITLTYPALRRARAVFFVAAGSSKREALDAIRAGEELPAARVVPADGGAVAWFVDEAAAGSS
tara:strand:- start:3452 stop:4174 length:723 start_codon:yes stop_codon:yes gene_type:complete